MANTFEWFFERSRKSRDQVAELSGLHVERVEAIIAGRWLPTPNERARLAAALDVQVDEVDWGHTMSPRNVRYHRFGLPDGLSKELS